MAIVYSNLKIITQSVDFFIFNGKILEVHWRKELKVKNIDDLGIFVSLTGDVNADMLKSLQTQMKDVLAKKPDERKVTLLLSTTGGRVVDGEAIYEHLKFLNRFVDLRIIATTYVMSAGHRIFIALPREKRFITPNGVIMVHPCTRDLPSVSFISYQERRRQLDEMMLDLDFSEKREMDWIRDLAKEIGLTFEETKALWTKSHRFTAREAIKRGLVADIIQY